MLKQLIIKLLYFEMKCLISQVHLRTIQWQFVFTIAVSVGITSGAKSSRENLMKVTSKN